MKDDKGEPGAEGEPASGKKKRGFGGMSPQKQREIASRAARAAHEKGGAFEYKKGSKKAREAGRKGGFTSRGGKGRENPTEEHLRIRAQRQLQRARLKWRKARKKKKR